MEKDFDVLTVGLNGSKLVEASAGTGKTYSIAVLALRLVIEKKIPIEKILMVTFTKAAVAELESRIRKFVRSAYKFATGKAIDDETIKKAVGSPNDEKIKVLRKAVQSLDSLSVMTIHSFCQKTIDEFTFETNQSFDYEIITDDTDLLKAAAIRYFREVLNIQSLEDFLKINKNVTSDNLYKLLEKHLKGMTFIDSSLDKDSTLKAVKENIVDKNNEFDSFLRLSFKQIINSPMKSNALKKEAIAGDLDEFKRRFRDQIKKRVKYFADYDFMEADFRKHDDGIKYAENEFINYFYVRFFTQSAVEIEKLKQETGFISYNDQIKTIHNALSNESFIEKLSKKYDAVFIDEFQDTDKLQYEIFSSVFSENSIVFYIGDPKQSIYGWRSADLDTYKLAKESDKVSVFSMNKNFRSTKKMIDALNLLLNPADSFNMFMDDDIRYINVGQGASGPGKMTHNGKEVLPLTVWEFDEDDFETNHRAVAQEIYKLLTDDVKINNRKITPKDIGILVRDKKEGDSIKQSLAGFNIPSVKRDSAKVLESGEAELIKNLIKAVISPNRGDINRALNSTYFGFNTDALKTIDDEKHIEIFLGLRKTLTDEGVYNMISSFLNSYNVRAHCINDVLGQRVLTNISQIAEILHKIEKQFKYTPEELLVWMERSSGEGDEEYEQRVESDDEAVQISTIHTAKGLEYNIVFAPFLSLIPKKKLLDKGNVNEFKKEGKYYFTLNYNGLSDEDKDLFDYQKEQENRRLVYVTLTRPVYKCYISLIPRKYRSTPTPSSLSEITDQYTGYSDLIEVYKLPKDSFEIVNGNYEPQNGKPEFSSKAKPEIEIKNTFGIHSFSALSKIHQSAPFEKVMLGEAGHYGQFVFQDLGRGANVGTALHSIFERLDFTDPTSWQQTLIDASKYYPNIIRQEKLDFFGQMVSHVMQVELHCGDEQFRLSSIKSEQKLPELEFCFSMNNVNKTAIDNILGEEADLAGEADIEGLMTGFIDLFFEHQGKYYILDWKSNFLGNHLDDYNTEGLAAAMKGNNYNLQYYIYTIAVNRWLEQKIPDFDYEKHFGGVIYLFLRGLRSDSHTGVLFDKPTFSQIESLENLFCP